MNHTYRLVWNRALSMFVAVSECARTMGKSGGAKAIAGAAFAAAVLSGPAALAHTTSVGYEILPSNAVEIWYGTYHNTSFTEGSLSFIGDNCYSSTVNFTDLVTVKPTGLTDGTTNFFSDGTQLIGTPTRTIYTWQGVTFSNLLAGTYTFTYLPLAMPTQDWQPIDDAIKTGSFVITAQALANAGGSPSSTIDTSKGGFNASTLAPTGTLQFQGGTLTSDVDQATLAQDYTIDNNGGTIDQAGHTATLTGAIADATAGTPGSLTVSNSGAGGSVILAGANTYSGQTTVDAGATLALAGAGTIAASSGVVANGVLDVSAAAGNAAVTTLSGNGGVVLGANSLVLTAASGNFAGAIAGNGGVRVAAGSETLSGANLYTGVTQVDSGAALTLNGNGSVAASSGVLNNGALTIASSAPAAIASLAGSGTVDLAGQSLFFTKAADNFSGVIGGTGNLVVSGGVQQLSGANTFAGAVGAIDGGTLQVASNASLGAAANAIVLGNGTLNTTGTTTMDRTLSLSGTGTVQTDAGTTLTSNGTTTGSGALVKTGAGTLVLGGDNSTLTGGARIAGGTLKLASASGVGSGAIALQAGTLETGANITLAQNIAVTAGTVISTDAGTTATLLGAISSLAGGDGCFTKSGAGTLNVTGSGSFGMGVCVAQGMLRANGLTGASFVNVDAGATLRGAGAVNAPITVSGTLAPGNSPGTLTTSANVTMLAGSTYQEDINGTGTATGPGNYSRLLISGAGRFNAGGATLTPNLVNITGADKYTAYVPKVGDSFRIITAAGGLVGRFAPLMQPASLADGTSLRVFYNGDGTNSIDLRVLPTSYASYSNANAGNINGQQSGAVLDRAMTADQAGNATAAQSALVYAVSNFAGGSVANVTQNLSGQVHAAMAAIAPLAGQAVQGTVTKQLDQAAPGDASARSALWADLAGNRAEWDADSHASGFVANRGQLTIGVDAFRNDSNRVGLGFSHARANLDADNGSGTLRENMVFAYGAHQGQVFGFDAMAGAGRTSWETERANPLAGGVLTTGMDGRNVLASVGISAPWQADGATFKPFVRVLWQRTERDAGSEGAGLAALSLGEYSASGTRTTAGLSGNTKGGDIGQTPYTMQYSVGVGRDNGSLARTTVDSSLAGMASTIVAPHASRSFFQAAVSGTVLHTASTSSYYGVATELHGNRADVSVSGGLRYAF